MYGRFLTKAANLVSFRVSITKVGDSLALKIWSTASYLVQSLIEEHLSG
jgi:hypothetical protein